MQSAARKGGIGRNKASHLQRSALIIKTWELVQKVIVPNLKLKTRHNCKYSYNDFFKLLTYAGINNGCAEGSANNLNFYSDERCPNGDTLLYHIKKFNTSELLESYERITDQIITIAKDRGILKGPVDVAIDYTDQLYYGDKNDPGVVGTKPQKGTTWAFRFATLTIIESYCRLTIKAIPVYENTPKSKVVAELLNYAKERIKIRVVCVDRGFYSAKVLSTIENLGFKYLIPALSNPRIKWMIRAKEPPKIIPFTFGPAGKQISTKLVIVLDKRMDNWNFVTNMDIDITDTRKLGRIYPKRWGIETSYRVKKDFRPKTTSKNYIIRLFYFLFSVCLYNLWELVNVVLALVKQIDPKTPVIAAKLFGTILFRVFGLAGKDPPPVRLVV
jgi:putative transposase